MSELTEAEHDTAVSLYLARWRALSDAERTTFNGVRPASWATEAIEQVTQERAAMPRNTGNTKASAIALTDRELEQIDVEREWRRGFLELIGSVSPKKALKADQASMRRLEPGAMEAELIEAKRRFASFTPAQQTRSKKYGDELLAKLNSSISSDELERWALEQEKLERSIRKQEAKHAAESRRVHIRPSTVAN